MIVYEVLAEDLTHLGGPMGSEYTTTKSLGIFSNLNKAMKCAEYHYYNETNRKRDEVKFIWKFKPNYDKVSSQDLGFIMYHIYRRDVK